MEINSLFISGKCINFMTLYFLPSKLFPFLETLVLWISLCLILCHLLADLFLFFLPFLFVNLIYFLSSLPLYFLQCFFFFTLVPFIFIVMTVLVLLVVYFFLWDLSVLISSLPLLLKHLFPGDSGFLLHDIILERAKVIQLFKFIKYLLILFNRCMDLLSINLMLLGFALF